VMDAGLVQRVVSLAKRAKPLLVYGANAIRGKAPEPV
jgi:hypothetical protein